MGASFEDAVIQLRKAFSVFLIRAASDTGCDMNKTHALVLEIVHDIVGDYIKCVHRAVDKAKGAGA